MRIVFRLAYPMTVVFGSVPSIREKSATITLDFFRMSNSAVPLVMLIPGRAAKEGPGSKSDESVASLRSRTVICAIPGTRMSSVSRTEDKSTPSQGIDGAVFRTF